MVKRIIWADYVKAFTIWLMVLGHSSLNNDALMNFITSFHVPVFFLISGYFEKGHNRTILYRIKKGWQQLVLPFIFFNILGLLSCWISPYLHPELYYNIHGYKIFTNAILGIFLMDDFVTSYSYLPVGPTWFLISLFICKVLFGIFIQISKMEKFKKYISYILFLLLIIILYQPQIHFASIDSAAMAFPFYVMGFYLKEYKVLSKKIPLKILVPVFISAVCVLWILSQYNGFVGVDGGNFGNSIILFYCDAIIGSFMIIFFSMILSYKDSNIRILSFIGENTLTILGVHISMLYIVKFFFVRFFKADMNTISTAGSIVMSLITLFLSLLLVIIFNKWCPKLIGKNVNNK